MPANGEAVIVSGQTNAQGFVEIISLELLPAGSVVPMGSPIEIEVESESEEEAAPPVESSSGSGNEATEVAPIEYEVSGTLQEISITELVINDMTVYLDDYILDQPLCIGMEIEVKGYYAPDGRFIVREVKGRGECSSGNTNGSSSGSNSNGDSNSNSDGGSNENSGDDGNTNSVDNSNDDDSSNDDSSNDDDNSGSGGGGDDDN